MTLREDRVELPNGKVVPEFHVIEYPDWALAIALTADQKVVMVEQYRHGIGEVGLEFPAGVLEEGEGAQYGAQRELREETGFAAEEWTKIGSCAPEPSKHTNQAFMYVARGAYRAGAPDRDHTEDITVHLVPLEKVRQMARQGKIRHGVHITALFWAYEKELL